MHLSILILAALAALTRAENSLTDVVNEFPSCSFKCLNKAFEDEGCKTDDFKCICDSMTKIVFKVGGLGCKCGSSDNYGK